jgi:hypothetical protein
MLVMQGIASHASAFADDMMFASQPDRANKFHELKQRKLETEAGMGIGKDIKLRMSDIRALRPAQEPRSRPAAVIKASDKQSPFS